MSVSYVTKKIYKLEETQKIQQELHIEFLRTLMEELMMILSKSWQLERVLPKTESELIAALESTKFTTTSDYRAFNSKIASPISCLEFNIDKHIWLLIGTGSLYFREKDNDMSWYNVCEMWNYTTFNDTCEMWNRREGTITLSKVFSNSRVKQQTIKSKNLFESYENYIKSCL